MPCVSDNGVWLCVCVVVKLDESGSIVIGDRKHNAWVGKLLLGKCEICFLCVGWGCTFLSGVVGVLLHCTQSVNNHSVRTSFHMW